MRKGRHARAQDAWRGHGTSAIGILTRPSSPKKSPERSTRSTCPSAPWRGHATERGAGWGHITRRVVWEGGEKHLPLSAVDGDGALRDEEHLARARAEAADRVGRHEDLRPQLQHAKEGGEGHG